MDAKMPSGTTTYTYNNMDRLTTRRAPLLKTESYVYDKAWLRGQIL
jgi:YD repeat-containing protein